MFDEETGKQYGWTVVIKQQDEERRCTYQWCFEWTPRNNQMQLNVAEKDPADLFLVHAACVMLYYDEIRKPIQRKIIFQIFQFTLQ